MNTHLCLINVSKSLRFYNEIFKLAIDFEHNIERKLPCYATLVNFKFPGIEMKVDFQDNIAGLQQFKGINTDNNEHRSKTHLLTAKSRNLKPMFKHITTLLF